MNIDLEQLETLLAVVDAGSFDDASIDLGITPSAVSQRIKALEGRIGAVLLERSRPVRATEQGLRALRYARQISLLGIELCDELHVAESATPKLNLSIGVNADSLATWFSPVFSSLAKWPELSCEIIRTDENRAMDLLRSGRVSAVVTNSPVAAQGCVVQPLGTMRYRAVAAPELVTRHFSGKNWQETMNDAPMVIFDRSDPLQFQMLEKITQTSLRPQGTIHYVPDSLQFAAAIGAGMGWGMVPEQQLHSFPALQVLDDNWFIDVELYWQRWSVESSALDRLSDILFKSARNGGLDLLA